MINSYKKPEILAPCGSYDIMIAAINAGADACYFGGNKFGARAYATNFDLETSLKAIDYAHIHNTSLYLTVNTLFKDDEIQDLYNYILPYYEAGLDAIIVQDLGVFKYINEMFPDMHIHCSTQMNVTSRYAAKGMKELGASRIVAAREMSLEDIAQIKREMDIEIESFVHGAMCYSYSGRCLMSSLAGGRSGNRGRCAQPCRKAYGGEYILSMKDMCTLAEVPKLIEAGIDSLKIEGRMKNEYYVASAVDAYNQIAQDFVDGCYNEKKVHKLKFKLANIYNRGGFCSGYYFMHNGPEMISKDRPNNQGVKLGKVLFAKDGEIHIKLYEDLYKQDVIELRLNDGSTIEITSGVESKKDVEVKLKCPKTKLVRLGQIALRTRCNHILKEVNDYNITNKLRYDLYGEFVAKIGEPLKLSVSRLLDGELIQTTAFGDVVQAARGKQVNVDDIKTKLCQLGNTCYSFAELKLNVEDDSFIPASAIKNLRRQAIAQLEESICKIYKRNSNIKQFVDKAKRIYNRIKKTPLINIGVSTYEQLIEISNVQYIHGVIFSLNLYKRALKDGIIDKIINAGIKLYLDTPYITNNSFDISEYLQSEAINGIYIRNIDTLFAYVNYEKALDNYVRDTMVICTDGVYAYNNLSREFIESILPNVIFELPKELNKKELLALENNHNQLVVYEYQQVMVSAQCVVKNKQGCNKSNSLLKLKDDKKNVFYAKAICEECCNVIYNGVPYMLLDQIDKQFFKDMGIESIKISFTVEDKENVRDILALFKAFIDADFNNDILDISKNIYTSGHYNRGVE